MDFKNYFAQTFPLLYNFQFILNSFCLVKLHFENGYQLSIYFRYNLMYYTKLNSGEASLLCYCLFMKRSFLMTYRSRWAAMVIDFNC